MRHQTKHVARCSYRHPVTWEKCMARATHRFAIDGEVRRDMGSVCKSCGEAVATEFAKKMPEYGLGLIERENDDD